MSTNFELIDRSKLPEHIAIIMDGNGRWANEKGQDRIFGHQNGVEAVRQTVEGCAGLGIKYLTLYAFSTENWQRPKNEINALMELLIATIRKETASLNENNIRLNTIGNIQQLPEKCQNELKEAIEETSKNTGLTLILALSYSSKWDIVNSFKKIAVLVRNDTIEPEQINEELVSSYLTTAPFPHPELLIRTSGEYRISNFLLWEIAYAELYFCDKHWPDFSKEELYSAILNYQQRERRFGKTSEQLKIE